MEPVKVGQILSCKKCGVELQVVKACGTCKKCEPVCCGEPMKLKEEK